MEFHSKLIKYYQTKIIENTGKCLIQELIYLIFIRIYLLGKLRLDLFQDAFLCTCTCITIVLNTFDVICMYMYYISTFSYIYMYSITRDANLNKLGSFLY